MKNTDEILAIIGSARAAQEVCNRIVEELLVAYSQRSLPRSTVLHLQRMLEPGYGADLRQRLQRLVATADA